MSALLPAGFEALESFVDPWAGASAPMRDELRTFQDAAARQAFHDAMTPLLVPALDRLDQTALAEHDAAETRLMQLTLSYAHVAMAIEVQGPDEEKHGRSRQRLPISRAPADA
jgi:hypothetical protein